MFLMMSPPVVMGGVGGCTWPLAIPRARHHMSHTGTDQRSVSVINNNARVVSEWNVPHVAPSPSPNNVYKLCVTISSVLLCVTFQNSS